MITLILFIRGHRINILGGNAVKLSKRLDNLMGHRVSVTMPAEGRYEYAIRGILQEVGDDYVMVTDWDRIGAFPIPGERIIPILLGISIIQSNDCLRCEKILPD